jgi:cysteine desulfurase
MIYLDHAASTPMRPGVWEEMSEVAGRAYGNSSGIHGVSRDAKNSLEEAREEIAALIGARPQEIVFTSGGTESDNLALKGAAWGGDGRSVVTVATEHEAVLETVDMLKRFRTSVSLVGVDDQGQVDRERLAACTDDGSVVSVMLVNNETGTIHDVASLSAEIKDRHPGALVHTDAIQAYASETIDVNHLGVDLLSLTAHKFGGPKGAGLLYVREGTVLEPVLHGGGQELGRRSGTHDVVSAVGLAAAMRLAAADRARFNDEVGRIRDGFESRAVDALGAVVVNTPEKQRSPHHFNVRFPGVLNETLLVRLDQAGVAASAGSACQSGAAEVSHVLEAMGLSGLEARESVRFSFGWSTTPEEVDRAADIVIELVGALR